jgi:hypothetical protein
LEISRKQVDTIMRDIMAKAGVVADGVDDERVAARNDRNFPELKSYLNRPNPREHLDKNDEQFEVEEVRHHGVAVRFHSMPRDANGRAGRQLLVRALSALAENHYRLGDSLEVYLPRYDRVLDVSAAEWWTDPEIFQTPVNDDLKNFPPAFFVAPNTMVLGPRASVPLTPGETLKGRAIDTEMQEENFGGVLHEMMHWLHYLNEPGLVADLDHSTLRSADLAIVGAVSSYALRDPLEFVAEYGLARLLGRRYDDPGVAARLDQLYRGLGGPLPQQGVGHLMPPPPTPEELNYLVGQVRTEMGRPVDSNLVSQEHARLSSFDHWRTLPYRAHLIAEALSGRRIDYRA